MGEGIARGEGSARGAQCLIQCAHNSRMCEL
jgi:hypothetical protein